MEKVTLMAFVSDDLEVETNLRALVVSTYRWEWQEVLAIEGALELKKQGYFVEYLDLSNFAKPPVKSVVKWMLNKYPNGIKRKKLLTSAGVRYIHPVRKIVVHNIRYRLLRLTPASFLQKNNSRWNIIFPGLVDITNDINVKEENYHNLVKRVKIADQCFLRLLENCNQYFRRNDISLSVNGRFPLNRAAAEFSRSQKTKVNFIEFGSNREKFEIYNKSPHSIKNRKELFEEFFSRIDQSNAVITEVGSQFFLSRRKFDFQANTSWTRHMNVGRLPENISTTKVCTFFLTSEKEFAGVRDIPEDDSFPNQFEALKELLSCLGPDWQIFIRRHPSAVERKFDPEETLWEAFEKISNVKVIKPDSTIDSYALGMRSDLVAHYSSSIGPELIFAGHKNVITLGPTAWESLDPERHLSSAVKLTSYIEDVPKRTSEVDISAYGYYLAKFGQSFKTFSWDGGKNRWVVSRK